MFHFFKKILMFYLFMKKRERINRGGAGRKGDTESTKQASGFQLSVQSPTMGLHPVNREIMT